MVDRSVARELARAAAAAGDPAGWFEELYRHAEAEPALATWDDHRPNPLLVAWKPRQYRPEPGDRALVVGCGYGEDAEWLAGRGFEVTAFDVSPTAISAARRRFPRST
ncbi:MAG: TPMT family class I SAM-dependent methyltransferase, partial [Thermoplasmata archaeon]|nr:TPMT family class I SAM-dependent methyltransferase [Thermoplasmata archaeon]